MNSQQDAMNRAMNNLSGPNSSSIQNNAFNYMGNKGDAYKSMHSLGLILDSCPFPMTMASYDPNDPIMLARAKQRRARKAAQAQEMRDRKEVAK